MEEKPYLPANRTEGDWFMKKWCEQCTRHSISPDAKTQCAHLLRAFWEGDNQRWYYVDGIPTCTAFRDKKNRKRYTKKPDKNQLDFFACILGLQ
jgi:hypothetical protein